MTSSLKQEDDCAIAGSIAVVSAAGTAVPFLDVRKHRRSAENVGVKVLKGHMLR